MTGGPSGGDVGEYGEIVGLTISNPPTQAEVEVLCDKPEELADDVRALAALIHSLRTAQSPVLPPQPPAPRESCVI